MAADSTHSKLDRLRLQELLEPVCAELATVTRLLVAAERREWVERGAVDLDLPRPQPPRDSLRTLRRARPHAARESVDRVVGDPHSLVLVVVRDDREHRPEDLLL